MVSLCENDNDNDLVKMTLMIQFATLEVLVAPPDMLQIQKMKWFSDREAWKFTNVVHLSLQL